MMDPSLDSRVYSHLISRRENALLFALLGPTCSSLACAVAQVYEAHGTPCSGGAAWHYKDSGVVCLVQDQSLRSNFLRLYSVKRGKMLWEQEIYTAFTYSAPRPFFHSFPADDCQVALNFADEAEATQFHSAMESLILRVEETRRAGKQPMSRSLSLDSMSSGLFRRTLDPSDLSRPSTTKQSTPTYWNQDKGFDVNNLDPALQKLFAKASISKKHLTGKHTSWLIHETIEQHGGLEAVRMEMQHRGHPPQALLRTRGPPSALTLKKAPLPSTSGQHARTIGFLKHSTSTQDLTKESRKGPLPAIPFSLDSVPPPPSVPAPRLPTSVILETGSPLALQPCFLASSMGAQMYSSVGQQSGQDGSSKSITAAYCKERDAPSTVETGSMLRALKKTMEHHYLLFTDENSDED